MAFVAESASVVIPPRYSDSQQIIDTRAPTIEGVPDFSRGPHFTRNGTRSPFCIPKPRPLFSMASKSSSRGDAEADATAALLDEETAPSTEEEDEGTIREHGGQGSFSLGYR